MTEAWKSVVYWVAQLVARFSTRRYGRIAATKRALHIFDIMTSVFDRVILMLGFVCNIPGVVVYGGIFVSLPCNAMVVLWCVLIFLASEKHLQRPRTFFKVAIFVWYVLLTFGRWSGSFADFSWA
jgi:hypothetical protein